MSIIYRACGYIVKELMRSYWEIQIVKHIRKVCFVIIWSPKLLSKMNTCANLILEIIYSKMYCKFVEVHETTGECGPKTVLNIR